MTTRVSPTEQLRAEIDQLFAESAGPRQLGDTLEEVARLGARLLLQTVLEAEVTEFLCRNRYERRKAAKEARSGSRNGYGNLTVKTTAGPVTLKRPKLRATTEQFASRLLGKGVTRTNALESLVIAGFVRGLSVRDVEATLAEAPPRRQLRPTGDFTESDTDLSIPTYGPALDFTRTYDAQLAEQQTMAGTPGAFGYGSTDSWASSLSSGAPTAGDIYTIAGLRTADGQGGSATNSPLNPYGVYVDSSGNLYIADDSDNRVEEIPATSGTHWGIAMTAGDIYTVAGSATGTEGNSGDGGPATSALLNYPGSVTVDSDGDLIIADTDNSRIQMVAAGSSTPYLSGTTAGDIYTIAGSAWGSQGHSGDGGAATAALLSNPADVTTGYGNNNLYIADTLNNRIQEVAASGGTQWGVSMTAGDIYTVAGSSSGTSGVTGDRGAATSALLDQPSGVDQSSAGTLFVADTWNNRIQDVCSTTGSCGTANYIYTFAGSSSGAGGHTGDGGAATSALLSQPTCVVAGNGQQLYIADKANNRIQEVAYSNHTEFGISMTAGDIYTIAGSSTGSGGYSGNGGAATSALLDYPEQIALDNSFDLYIADTGNDRVREVSASTAHISAVAGNGYTLADTGDSGPALASGLVLPWGVAIDTAGDAFIGDNNGRVQEIAASSHTQFGVTMTAGDIYTVAGGGAGAWGGPAIGAGIGGADVNGVALDSAGDLYIAINSLRPRSPRQLGHPVGDRHDCRRHLCRRRQRHLRPLRRRRPGDLG